MESILMIFAKLPEAYAPFDPIVVMKGKQWVFHQKSCAFLFSHNSLK